MVLLIETEPTHLEYTAGTRPVYQLNDDKKLLNIRNNECDCQMYKGVNFISCPTCSDIKKKKTRKKLRFSDDTRVVEVMGWREMSRKEHKATWYRKREYKNIKSENGSIAKFDIKDCVELSKHGQHTVRGLEHLIDKQYSAKRNQMRRALFRAVLGAQTRQRLLDYLDLETISVTSSLISKKSRDLAQAIGEADAAFVRSLSNESLSFVDGEMTKLSQSLSRSEMGVIEYILSQSGVDVTLYFGSAATAAAASDRVTQSETSVKVKLGEYFRCGLFARIKNGTGSLAGIDPTTDLLASFAIYDADGKRLWSWQSQLL